MQFPNFKPDLRAVHTRDLNFILWLKIFVHFDGQLQALHFILSCVPSYTSYQDPRPALTVGSPLLSYINVRLLELLPMGLSLGEGTSFYKGGIPSAGPRWFRRLSLSR